MTDLGRLLTIPENLHWAWNKARKIYEWADFWFDEAEVAAFDASLDTELDDIADQFRCLTYRMSPLKPVPYPKKIQKDEPPKLRPMFHFSVKDQVAWIAFVNVVGPWLDSQMPTWSYGNRLYQARWLEKTDKGFKLNIGNYRHSPGGLYRTFQQSWPVFRRHVFLTVRAMSGLRREVSDLDETDANVLQAQEYFEDRFKLPYLKDDYWGKAAEEVFWASIDIEKFYPNLHLKLVAENLSSLESTLTDEISELAQDLLRFPIDYKGCNEIELKMMGLSKRPDHYRGIPTGLFVGGFLANVGMLGVDRQIAANLAGSRQVAEASVAHFRYVDDHVFLARDFDSLVDWIRAYERILKDKSPVLRINEEKIQPRELRTFLVSSSSSSDTNQTG